MGEEVAEEERRLEEIVEREKEKEIERGAHEGVITRPEEEPLPVYVEVFADKVASRLGISKESILRGIREVFKTEDPSLRKLVKLTEISKILTNIKRSGGLTSQIADYTMARLTSAVSEELEKTIRSNDEDSSWKMMNRLRSSPYMSMLYEIMMIREISRAADRILNDSNTDIRKTVAEVVAEVIKSVEERISKIEEEIRGTKTEKSFFDKMKEVIDSTITSRMGEMKTRFDEIDKRMKVLEEKIKEMEEEKRKKEMEEVISKLEGKLTSITSEIERLKESIKGGVITATHQPMSIVDMVKEYKNRIDELDKALKEVESVVSKFKKEKKESHIDQKILSELNRLRSELERVKEKADMLNAVKDIITNPDSIVKWFDVAEALAKKINSIRKAFVEREVVEEVPQEVPKPPSFLEKAVEEAEVSEGEKGGEAEGQGS